MTSKPVHAAIEAALETERSCWNAMKKEVGHTEFDRAWRLGRISGLALALCFFTAPASDVPEQSGNRLMKRAGLVLAAVASAIALALLILRIWIDNQ